MKSKVISEFNLFLLIDFWIIIYLSVQKLDKLKKNITTIDIIANSPKRLGDSSLAKIICVIMYKTYCIIENDIVYFAPSKIWRLMVVISNIYIRLF